MQPIVKPLSLWRRNLVFGTLLLAFLISLPAFIFYATGYRYDFLSQNPALTITGGFYISAEAPESVIYIDDVPVDNVRTFRNASYIQGLEPGLHRIYVQAPGLHTWVKELVVYPRLVTEAESFNLPLTPQVRLVTEYVTSNTTAVMFGTSSTLPVLFGKASTTPVTVATATATSTYRMNQEFVFLTNLFAEKASSTAELVRLREQRPGKSFGFSTTTVSSAVPANTATTTVEQNNLRLYESNGEIYVRALGTSARQIPHYFCAEQPLLEEVSVVSKPAPEVTEEVLVEIEPVSCRQEIRLDRKGQTVHDFGFYPENTDLVLVQLDDGIYVVEIDDRAWQNTQLLYPGTDLTLLLYGGGIFVQEGDVIFEVLPEIAS